MDRRTDGQNFSPFYSTLSPVGAAALLPFALLHNIKDAGQGYLVMIFGDWLGLCWGQLGSKMQVLAPLGMGEGL